MYCQLKSFDSSRNISRYDNDVDFFPEQSGKFGMLFSVRNVGPLQMTRYLIMIFLAYDDETAHQLKQKHFVSIDV